MTIGLAVLAIRIYRCRPQPAAPKLVKGLQLRAGGCQTMPATRVAAIAGVSYALLARRASPGWCRGKAARRPFSPSRFLGS